MSKAESDRQALRSVAMSSPDLSEAERTAVAEVLQTRWLATGPRARAFEAAVAATVGVRHAVAVNSGTAALHLSLLAAGVKDGDLGLTTPFSFVASSNVYLYERAVPVFVDVDPLTGNLDPALAAAAAADLKEGGSAGERWLPPHGARQGSPLTSMLAVDVFGQPADYDRLRPLAAEHDLVLIEDSCEALGAGYNGRAAGTLADVGAFAFFPNKQVTTGEGGMIVTDNDEWAAALRALRNQGRSPEDAWLEYSYIGYNYRMDEMSAALGEVQVGRLDELLTHRHQVAGWYGERLARLEGVEPLEIVPSTTSMSWFVYVVRLDPAIDSSALLHTLKERGIPTRPYFTPIHLQPPYIERFGYREGMFPVAEDLGRRSLALPFSGVMTQDEVHTVCDVLAEVIA